MSTARPWVAGASGVSVTIRLTPKGGRDAIEGIEQLADGNVVLKARVRAAAVDGAANEALIRLIADALGIARRNVALIAGQTARIKRLKIAGDGPALAAAFERMAEMRRNDRKDH
jgi:uncharacterized protein YggU (UPF0235/DUF167 family)